MPIDVAKSKAITDLENSPRIITHKQMGVVHSVIDHIKVTAEQVSTKGDIILIAPIPSNAVILELLIKNDDLDTGGTQALRIDIGLYYSGIGGNQAYNGNKSGDVIRADCFASNITPFIFKNSIYGEFRNVNNDLANNLKEAWQIAGLSSDTGGHYYVGFKLKTPAITPTAGDIVVEVRYLA